MIRKNKMSIKHSDNPIDMLEDLAIKKGLEVNRESFNKAREFFDSEFIVHEDVSAEMTHDFTSNISTIKFNEEK